MYMYMCVYNSSRYFFTCGESLNDTIFSTSLKLESTPDCLLGSISDRKEGKEILLVLDQLTSIHLIQLYFKTRYVVHFSNYSFNSICKTVSMTKIYRKGWGTRKQHRRLMNHSIEIAYVVSCYIVNDMLYLLNLLWVVAIKNTQFGKNQ